MRNKAFFLLIYLFTASVCLATSNRIQQISNNKVNVWQRTIQPNDSLKMHRHEHDHVVIALTDGVLKIENNQNKIHIFTLKKGHSYYLPRDSAGESHSDKNISKHPVKVVVVEIL